MKKIVLVLGICFCALFGDSLDQIKQKGVFRVGVYESQPPFEKFVDGKFEGFEIDLANSIAKDLFGENGGTVEFVIITAKDRIPALQQNKIDAVTANYTVTDERAKSVDFTMPYFAVNTGILTRKNDNITSPLELRDTPIICEKGTTTEEYLQKNDFKIEYCNSAVECYKMVRDGKAKAYAADNIVVMAYPVLDRSVEVSIKNLGTTDFLAIGVQKGNKTLLDFINDELIKLSKEGFFKKSFNETIQPFYKGHAEKKYFLLEDIYSVFG